MEIPAVNKQTIKWEATDPDDFIFSSKIQNGDSYTLRVENMDEDNWWACLYINDEMVWDNNEKRCISEKEAKTQVLKALNNYIRKVNKILRDK